VHLRGPAMMHPEGTKGGATLSEPKGPVKLSLESSGITFGVPEDLSHTFMELRLSVPSVEGAQKLRIDRQ
jgi:hypothetical protein